jgi:hypothetical protein
LSTAKVGKMETAMERTYHLMLAEALHASKKTAEACAEWKRALSLRSGYEEEEYVKEARAMIDTHCRG